LTSSAGPYDIFHADAASGPGRGQRRPHPFEILAQRNEVARGSQVLRLPGIGIEVVDFGDRGVHELEPAPDEAPERSAALVEEGLEGFEVNGPVLAAAGLHEAGKGPALEGWPRREAEEIADRREDVDVSDARRHPARRDARTGDDQGDVERAVVSEVAVRQLAVLSERFPVVGGEDDERSLPGTQTLDLRQKRADLGVDVGRFPRIGIFPIPGGERLGRRVRRVGVPEVDPAEPFSRPAGKPVRRGLDDLGRPALPGRPAGGCPAGERVVVDVEVPVEAESGIQGEGPDERAGGVSGGLEVAGHGREIRREFRFGVLADPVKERRHPREDVGVGRQRRRIVGEGPFEADAPRGQGVDRRRRRVTRGVAAQPVGAQRVDRDEEDVGAGGRGGLRQEEDPGREADRFTSRHGLIIQ
jgi:hypothetical protein